MIILLILLEIKHVMADYFFQRHYQWIGIGKRLESGWIYPLAMHASHHGIRTMIMIFLYTKNVLYSIIAGVFDFSTHFIIDRIKSSPNFFGAYIGNTWQSWLLTIIDQSLHQVVIFIILYYIYEQE